MQHVIAARKEPSKFLLKIVFGSLFLLGAYLTVSTIVISSSSLSAETIKFVLIPGTIIGSLMMLFGSLGFGITSTVTNTADQLKLEKALPIVIAMGIAVGFSVGTSVGLMFGFIALGMAIGPLTGIVIAMAVWKKRLSHNSNNGQSLI